MKDYILITDNTCDLDDSYYSEHNIPVTVLPYSINDVVYGIDKSMSLPDFYNAMRDKIMPTTMACNPDSYSTTFEKYLCEGKDVIHLAFSSALSSSYGNAILAADELIEKYPDRQIKIIDSLCASCGEGLLLYRAVREMENGATFDELVNFIEDNKMKICHYFTVDDLNHLYRGGRVSKSTAVVGSIINIKPILHVDNEGHLIPVGNSRGRKKSLLTLVDYMEKITADYEGDNDVVMISHGDCEEDAKFVASEIKKRFGTKEVIISYVSQTIGAHAGPGVISIFFMGNHR
ncbi:MAG: DegV family protein [Clostridiales bacterium]|nr:DegV family protein [Clostridiales bacterium]